MPDLMELNLWQTITVKEPGKILPISSRLCWGTFTGEEIVAWIIRIELLDDIPQK